MSLGEFWVLSYGLWVGPGFTHNSEPVTQNSRLKTIAVAMDGMDKGGVTRIGFDFLAQPGDVYVHRAGEHCGIVAPDRVEKFVARESLAQILDKVPQQLEFTGG